MQNTEQMECAAGVALSKGIILTYYRESVRSYPLTTNYNYQRPEVMPAAYGAGDLGESRRTTSVIFAWSDLPSTPLLAGYIHFATKTKRPITFTVVEVMKATSTVSVR